MIIIGPETHPSHTGPSSMATEKVKSELSHLNFHYHFNHHNYKMYRYLARSGAVRQCAATVPHRLFSQNARTSFNHGGHRKIKAVAGLTLTAFVAMSFMNRNIHNDVDEAKIEKDLEAAVEASEEAAAPVEGEEQEQESSESGHEGAAYNPETGEINWDCPCLGGMAHGPCGEEFKEAFACFVYSETEPKGIDCIKKFEAMRSCFRKYPEHYKEELYEDDEDVSAGNSTVAETDVVEVFEAEIEQPVTEESK
ncbi:uncharacterized protein RJT21DRAFT_50623 [Scheffersomyces amazonensis]|uniref:uncharacterized protein n=1 Tax=Scheffersomyces amazonensis TaxID=1078765 RepID=UPI00315CDC66